MDKDNVFLDLIADGVIEELNNNGIALSPSNSELIFKLRQKYIDLEYVNGNGHTVLYLSSVIDPDYYHKFIKNLKPDKDYSKINLLLLLKDFINLSREKGTSLEEEIEEFYNL